MSGFVEGHPLAPNNWELESEVIKKVSLYPLEPVPTCREGLGGVNYLNCLNLVLLDPYQSLILFQLILAQSQKEIFDRSF